MPGENLSRPLRRVRNRTTSARCGISGTGIFLVGRPTPRMSALGQKRTSHALAIYARYWGLSGRSRAARGMSAYSHLWTFGRAHSFQSRAGPTGPPCHLNRPGPTKVFGPSRTSVAKARAWVRFRAEPRCAKHDSRSVRTLAQSILQRAFGPPRPSRSVPSLSGAAYPHGGGPAPKLFWYWR